MVEISKTNNAAKKFSDKIVQFLISNVNLTFLQFHPTFHTVLLDFFVVLLLQKSRQWALADMKGFFAAKHQLFQLQKSQLTTKFQQSSFQILNVNLIFGVRSREGAARPRMTFSSGQLSRVRVAPIKMKSRTQFLLISAQE